MTVHLNEWANLDDVPHASRPEAETAQREDARWLTSVEFVLVDRARGFEDEGYHFAVPVRAVVTNVTDGGWKGIHLDPTVEFEFLEPVDAQVFPPDENGIQRGRIFGRTHMVEV